MLTSPAASGFIRNGEPEGELQHLTIPYWNPNLVATSLTLHGCWGLGGSMAAEDRVSPDPVASEHDAAREPSRPRVLTRITDSLEAWQKLLLAIGGILAAIPLLWAGINHLMPSGHASASTGPEAVVEDFYAAINKHDWLTVWSLGGKYLGYGPYKTLPGMIHGYHCTLRDTVKGLTSSRDTGRGILSRTILIAVCKLNRPISSNTPSCVERLGRQT